MSFVLGQEAREKSKRSLKGLKAYASKQETEGATGPEPIYLVLNTKTPLIKQKDYTPRIIPITNKLHAIDEKSIALITRDGSFKQTLTAKDAATEDLFNEIIPFKKIKSMGHKRKSMVKLYKENDLVIADTRIHKQLPEILGSQFYAKNKKVPFKILMAMPVPGQKTHGKVDQSCDPKFVRSQVRSIVGDTSILPSEGTCVNIVVGYTDWKVSDILVNINDVVQYLIDEKNLPVGGILRSVENLNTVYVKTSNSAALPVIEKKQAAESDSELSDF